MTHLQIIFYITSIVFMVVILCLIVALVVTALVIRSKVVAIHGSIENKLETVNKIAEKSKNIFKMMQ